MNTPYASAPRPERNAGMLEQVRLLAIVPLGDLFGGVLDALPGLLDRSAGEHGEIAVDLIEARQELLRRRERALARFRAHLANAWQAMEAGRPLSVEYKLADAGKDESARSRLDLMSHQQIEVRLAIGRMAEALGQRARAELMALNRYVGLLAGGLRLGDDTLPFGPQHIGAAVHDAYSDLVLTHPALVQLVNLTSGELHARVPLLYASLERRIQQVMHDTDMALLKPRARARIPGLARQVDHGAGDWVARFFAQWQAQGLVHGGESGGAALPPGLHALLQRRRHVGQPAPAGQRQLSRREILSVLSLMQSFGKVPAAAQGEGLGQQLKQDILAQAARLGIDGRAGLGFAPADEDTLDLMAMLFEVLLRDSDLSGQVRQQMLRLLLPYAKVALTGPQLFLREHNAPRRLLNLLADASEYLMQAGPAEGPLQAAFDQMIDRVAGEFADNLELFDELAGSFAQTFAAYRRKVEIAERRATEMHRAQERRDQARRFAVAALAERTGSRALPQALEDFLGRYWVGWVAMAAIRGEAGAAELSQAFALADALLQELDLARVHGQARDWLREIEPQLTRMLDQLGLSPADARRIAQVLREAFQSQAVPVEALPEPPAAVQAAVVATPEPSAWEDAGPPICAEQADPTTAAFFRDLPLGTWLDFIARDGRARPGKLSWVSPISARLMFVDRRGGRMCVASPDELSAMAHLDRVRLHRGEDAFYSAMQGAVDQLES